MTLRPEQLPEGPVSFAFATQTSVAGRPGLLTISAETFKDLQRAVALIAQLPGQSAPPAAAPYSREALLAGGRVENDAPLPDGPPDWLDDDDLVVVGGPGIDPEPREPAPLVKATGQAPMCPDGHGAMRPSKYGGHYCTHRDGNQYCKQKHP